MSSNFKYGSQARLFPTVKSDEDRATSIFLATFAMVYEFRYSLMISVGRKMSKRGHDFSVTTHPRFGGRYSPSDIPDGLIVHDKGSEWRAAIEVKIKRSDLDQGQLERYLKQVKENRCDALITISNEMCSNPERPPLRLVSSDKHLKKIPYYHWSWKYISHTAERLVLDEAIKDETQLAVLKEFILFLKDPKSGVAGFTSMNQNWSEFVDDLRVRGNPGQQAYEDAVSDWHQESSELTLILAEHFKKPVVQIIKKANKTSQEKRLSADVEHLKKTGDLQAAFEIDGIKHPLKIDLEVDQRCFRISMCHDLPTRVSTPYKRIEHFLKNFHSSKEKTESGKHDHVHIFAKWPYINDMTNTTLFDAIQRMNDDKLRESKLIRDDKDSIQYVELTYSPAGIASDIRSRKKIIATIESQVRFFCEHYVF